MTTALVKSVAAKALVNAKEKGQQAFQNTNVQKALGVVILGTGAYFLGRKLWRDWQSKHQEKLTSTSIHSQQALQIYNATRWNKKNPQLLLNMVRQGIDAKNVDKAYSKLYGHTMYDDIRKTLSQDQLAVFMNAINNTPSVAKDTPPATTSEFINTSMAGKAVRFKNSAKVWKDIDGIPHAVKKVEAGSILKNTTTGVVKLRSILLLVNQEYIEVRVKTKDGGKIHLVYVNSEEVDLIDPATLKPQVLVNFYDNEF